jgi:hypothetical protein
METFQKFFLNKCNKISNYVNKLHTKFLMANFKNSVVTCYQMES